MPLEKHPWLTIWLHPRPTVRRVVDSGRRRDVLLISLAWGTAGSAIFAEAPKEIVPTGIKLPIAVFPVLFGPLLMTGVIYMNGALVAWGARKVGSKATTGQVSEALALSMVPFVSWFVLGAILSPFLYGMAPAKGHPPPLWNYLLVALGPVLLLWSIILRRSCILEVEGLSPREGRRATWLATKRYFTILLAFVLSCLVVITVISAIARLLG